MEMSKPGEGHARIARLAGEWAGDEILHPSPNTPDGGRRFGRLSARVILDGFFVVQDYTEEKDGVVVYAGHAVFGHDDKRDAPTMNWFDSMGGQYSAPAFGTWDGDAVTFVNEGPWGTSRCTYELRGDDELLFKLELAVDGEEFRGYLDGTYQRA